MARLKRSSAVLEKAMRRSAGMRSISSTLDFGSGLSLAEYDAQIQALQAHLSSYNTMLSSLDEMGGRIALMEQALREHSERMLMSVATRYGKDSLQYVQAGGTRRKRSLSRTVSPSIGAAPSLEKANSNGSSIPVI